jgi:hypothetical protein
MQISLGGLVRAGVIPRALALKLMIGIFDLPVLGAMLLYKQHAIKHTEYGMTTDEFILMIKNK